MAEITFTKKIPKRLYTLKEAGFYLGRSEWTMAQMVRQGIFDYVHSGRRKLLDVKDLDEWIEKGKVNDAA